MHWLPDLLQESFGTTLDLKMESFFLCWNYFSNLFIECYCFVAVSDDNKFQKIVQPFPRKPCFRINTKNIFDLISVSIFEKCSTIEHKISTDPLFMKDFIQTKHFYKNAKPIKGAFKDFTYGQFNKRCRAYYDFRCILA